MANIKKDEKTGTYYFKISLGTDPVTGKRRQTTRRGFKKKSDAVKVYNELKNQYYDGVLIYNNSTKTKDFIEDYLKWYKTQVRATTFNNRSCSINKNIMSYFGEYKLDQITPMMIQKWQQNLLDNGLDKNYIRNLHKFLTQILDRAVALDLIKNNPTQKAGNIKPNKREVAFWTEDEFLKVITTFDTNDISQHLGCTIINFLFYTGLRFSEMQALTWNDLDSTHKLINVTKDLIYKNQEDWEFDELKSKSSNRKVFLDDECYNTLQKWKKVQSNLFNVKQDSFIFSFTGIPVNHYFTLKTIERHAKIANVHRIRIHALRHSHASFLIQLGVNIIAISKRLGHADVQEVLKTYGHLYPEHQHEVTNSINDHKIKKRGHL